MTLWKRCVLGLLAALTAATAAQAQQPIIYPSRGQTPEQQQADQGVCYTWAQQTTGVNPMSLGQQSASAPPAPRPGAPLVVGAAGGAAAGAVVGAIAGNAGKGAGIGAVAGLVGGGIVARNRQAAYHTQHQQQQAAVQQSISTFNRAYNACLEGRGYVVK